MIRKPTYAMSIFEKLKAGINSCPHCGHDIDPNGEMTPEEIGAWIAAGAIEEAVKEVRGESSEGMQK